MMKTKVVVWSSKHNLYTIKYKKKWWHFWKPIGKYYSDFYGIGGSRCIMFVELFENYDYCVEYAKELLEEGEIETYEKDLHLQYEKVKAEVKAYNKDSSIKSNIVFKN